MRNLRADLNNTFEDLGINEALVRSGGSIGVNAEKIDCDYYEYMLQYSFAEGTLGLVFNRRVQQGTGVD